MSKTAKSALQTAITALTAAKGTDGEAAAWAAFYNQLGKAETSVQTFARLNNSTTTVNDALTNNTSKWAKTIADAEEAYTTLSEAYNNEDLTDNEAVDAVISNSKIVERLGYKYLDITISTPGDLGDLILAEVEYFNEVQSLKLSGKLNNDDITTIKDRLTSLREIDLADLDWEDIPKEQFSEKQYLEQVILPNNIKSIGRSAFSDCQKLKYIVFPKTLTSIDELAFYRTYGLGDIVLPEGLTSVGAYAFYQSRLTSVTLPSTLKTIPYACFYDCNFLKEINFNDQVTIEAAAFYSCEALTKLIFPKTLNTIHNDAFSYAKSVTRIEFNEGLYKIGDNAFNDCDGLTEVTLPSTLVHANESPFDYCDNLMKVTCLSIEPPLLTDQIPYGLNMEGRELYVPALSLNVYKQSTGWDKFQTIKPIDSYPENIVIYKEYRLNWPDDLNKDYKPNVTLSSTEKNDSYGSLSINGTSTLSAGLFKMKYDPNVARDKGYYDENDNYTYNRFAYTSLVNNSVVRADNITTELWLRVNEWEFLTFPYDVKVSDIRMANDDEVSFVIRKYDGQKRAEGQTGETWVDMKGDDILEAGVGYIWKTAKNQDRYYNGFYLDALQTVNKNNMFVNDNVEVPLVSYQSEFEHNRSWNLIGNPYPCFYDTRAMQTSAPITVWDTYHDNYRAYSPADDSYILNPGQAFFVQCPVNESSIIFLKEGRQNNLTVRDIEYNNNVRAKGPKGQRSVFNLILTNNGKSDRTRFVINENAALDYESACDASKFMSLEQQVPQLYTVEQGVRFAINERPMANGQIQLGLQLAADDLYTISLDTKADNEVYLIDHLTGMKTRLDGTEGYTFHSEAGTFENRFTIVMDNGIATGIQTATAKMSDADAPVFDLQGRRISQPQKGVYLKNGKKVIVK